MTEGGRKVFCINPFCHSFCEVDCLNGHYFDPHPDTPHEIRTIEFKFRGIKYKFETDRGVFSRKRVDTGSKILLKNIVVRDNDCILDLGCGYGVLGIVASQMADNTELTLVDVNHRAVRLAEENLLINKINNSRVLVSDGFNSLQNERFDLILFNPPLRSGKKNVLRMADECSYHLSNNGRLYFVVRTKQGAKSYKRELGSIFTDVQTINKTAGYRVFRAVQQVED